MVVKSNLLISYIEKTRNYFFRTNFKMVLMLVFTEFEWLYYATRTFSHGLTNGRGYSGVFVHKNFCLDKNLVTFVSYKTLENFCLDNNFCLHKNLECSG